jgi:hypothetical protein
MPPGCSVVTKKCVVLLLNEVFEVLEEVDELYHK